LNENAFEIDMNNYGMNIQFAPPVSLENHPLVQWYSQNEKIYLQEKDVNLARQLPELNVGYFNQSLVGIQNIDGVDTKFTQANRFQGFMLGANIPLFWGAFQNRNEVTAVSLKQNQLKQEQETQAIQLGYQQLLDHLTVLSTSIDQLGGQLTNELHQLSDDANIKLEAGEISLIEYLQVQTQRSELELSYLQLINQYNQTSIQLNWYR
jgi:cobalt-zinc-cadmium resistance protein CzcA